MLFVEKIFGNDYVPEGFETGRGRLEPMSGFQAVAKPAQITTPGALGLPGTPSIYSAFKVFEAMGNKARHTYKVNVEGYGGFSFNQLFANSAIGGIFNKDQVS